MSKFIQAINRCQLMKKEVYRTHVILYTLGRIFMLFCVLLPILAILLSAYYISSGVITFDTVGTPIFFGFLFNSISNILCIVHKNTPFNLCDFTKSNNYRIFILTIQ